MSVRGPVLPRLLPRRPAMPITCKQKLAVCRDSFKADARTRTGDPFITSEVLYQLSYVGEADGV